MESPLLRPATAAVVIGISKQAVAYALEHGLLVGEDVGTGVTMISMTEALRYKRERAARNNKWGWPKGKPRPSRIAA